MYDQLRNQANTGMTEEQMWAAANDSVVLCAPTGVAAHLINGVTVSSLLSIPVISGAKIVRGVSDLKGEELKKLQNKFCRARVLILDEATSALDRKNEK